VRWLLVFALVVAWCPGVARAQVVEVCEAPWLDAARLVEALRIEVGEVDATFRVDQCGTERARVSIMRQGRTLVRLVPFFDTPDALRVRLIAIVLAELLHTDEALRELSRVERDAPSGPPTNRSVDADGQGAIEVDVAEALLQTETDAVSLAALDAEARPHLVLDAQLGLRIFPPLPVRYTDDEFVTMEVSFGVEWRRLLARASVLARSRGDEAGRVKFRAYLGVLGARLIDALDGAWRLQLDVLGTVGLMQARGHFDPNPEDGAGVRHRPTAGLALALGIAHDQARSRIGFRWELGYLKGIRVDQGGRRVGTLNGWNVAFHLSFGFRVDGPRGAR
jgi:hypothetical protein